MARMTDDRNKKRQRLSGSDSSARSKQGHDQDAKMHEESPASTKDRSLRTRGKESPPEVAERARLAEQIANNMPLPLHQEGTTERSEEKSGSSTKGLPSVSGQRPRLHDSSGSRRKSKGSPDVDDLKSYVESLGGVLEDGWHVDAQRRHGKLSKTFTSPSNEKFRSRIEVAKHLGLSANLPKKGESAGAHPTANNEVQMDRDVAKTLSAVGNKKGSESRLRDRSRSKDTGQKKEHGVKSTKSHEKAVVKANNGIPLTSDALKTIVDEQKTPVASIVTQRCQDALRSIISTDSFAALSNMLNRGSPSGSLESPLQLKALPLIASSLDLQLIHLRLSNGVYGLTPELFSADIQQVWKNITSAGNELVAQARYLSEFSDKLYKQQILSLFQGSASKEIMEGKEQLLSTQHIEDSGLPLDNAHTLQENQLVTPPQSTPAMQASMLQQGTPGQVTVEGSFQSLPKRDGAMSKPYKSKRRPKKAAKSKKPQVFVVKAADNNRSGVCKTCGLQQDMDCVLCRLCNSVFHTHCIDISSNTLPDSEWCCPSCTTNKNVDKSVEEKLASRSNKSKRRLLKITGKAGVCEACKKEDVNVLLCDACEAAYHMKCLTPAIDSIPDDLWYCPTCAEDQKLSMIPLEEDAHKNSSFPDDHNCTVCDVIHKDSPLPIEDVSTENEIPGNPSSLVGVRSPDHINECVAPKHVMELESPEAGAEKGSIEPAFLIENENACKVCGVENTKAIVSCAWCLKRFHLSCLRPSLKRPPRKAWYCPSCLCRVCKIDADDDKILLCDTCDEGYHTYCLDPPLSEKPEGAWFCPSCAKSEDVAPSSPGQSEGLKRKRKSTEPRRST